MTERPFCPPSRRGDWGWVGLGNRSYSRAVLIRRSLRSVRWFPSAGCGVAALSTRPTPAVKPHRDPLDNEAVAPEFTNRNPRNLELLAVARKERGWGTVWPSREFWHR